MVGCASSSRVNEIASACFLKAARRCRGPHINEPDASCAPAAAETLVETFEIMSPTAARAPSNAACSAAAGTRATLTSGGGWDAAAAAAVGTSPPPSLRACDNPVDATSPPTASAWAARVRPPPNPSAWAASLKRVGASEDHGGLPWEALAASAFAGKVCGAEAAAALELDSASAAAISRICSSSDFTCQNK